MVLGRIISTPFQVAARNNTNIIRTEYYNTIFYHIVLTCCAPVRLWKMEVNETHTRTTGDRMLTTIRVRCVRADVHVDGDAVCGLCCCGCYCCRLHCRLVSIILNGDCPPRRLRIMHPLCVGAVCFVFCVCVCVGFMFNNSEWMGYHTEFNNEQHD